MTVLITGANRGIGKALYDRYSSRSSDTIGTARTPAAGQDFVTLDVSDAKSFGGLRDAVDDTPIDLLICNAGVYLDKGHTLDDGYVPDLWAESFAVNVTGVFLTVQTLLPNLRAATDAKIAIISSQMASHERAPGGSYIYRASKAAALNLGRNLASDLRADGIAVGIYHPGWVKTDMGSDAAELTVDEAADGLVERFDALSMETTGVFETWDGRPHVY